jgi:hypothetical protein
MFTPNTDFETKCYAMGLNYGMFAYNDNGYIGLVTKELYNAYTDKKLNANLVHSLLNSLK